MKYSVFFNHLNASSETGVILVLYSADSSCQQFQDVVVVGCGVVLNSARSVLYEYCENVQLVEASCM